MCSKSSQPTFAVIITALDETWSVKQTVERVAAENADDVAEIIMAIAPHTTAACREAIDEMETKFPDLVRRLEQRELPGVGGAIRECVATVKAPWTLMMAADLETPPESVKDIVRRAMEGDVDIVATSRWIKGGAFGDYNRVKLVCNWIFQKMFSLLYLSRLTDMTYGYRAYKTAILQDYRWKETGMAFFMESICRPLRCGERIAEVPVKWQRRREGISHITLAAFLRYFRIGLAVRLASKASIAPKRREAMNTAGGNQDDRSD